MTTEVTIEIKDEIERLINVGLSNQQGTSSGCQM